MGQGSRTENQIMTRAEILARFPNASKSLLELADDHHPPNPRPAPKLERHLGHESLATSEGPQESAGRVLVRVCSVRKRLLDPDNISEKGIVDCLRFCGALRGDEPDKITLETSQRKAEKGEQEHTLITITYP